MKDSYFERFGGNRRKFSGISCRIAEGTEGTRRSRAMRVRFLLAPVLVLAVVVGGRTLEADAAEIGRPQPASFIRSLADEAIAVLNEKSAPPSEREARFRSILLNGLDIARIGRFAAGAYWRRMSTTQRAEYQKLFSEWVIKTYWRRLSGYAGETVRVLGTSRAGSRDVFVRTRIERSNGKSPVRVDWRVRWSDGHYKILDVVIEGVSMVVTQKAEFTAVMRRDGIEGLLGALRNQLHQVAVNTRS